MCLSDLITQLLDPVVDPWLDREICYNLVPVPDSYTGPRISFPLGVSDTNTLLSAFKEQQVPNTIVFFIDFYRSVIVCFKGSSPHRFSMPDMFFSCFTKPKSSSNRCQTSTICQHPTPRTSPYVVGGLSLSFVVELKV